MLDQINDMLMPVYLFFLYLGIYSFISCTEHLDRQSNLVVENIAVEQTNIEESPIEQISNIKNYHLLSMTELKQLVTDMEITIPDMFDRRYKKNWITLLEN